MKQIKTIITDGLDNKSIITRLNNKYPNTTFKDTRPEIIRTYKKKLTTYITNYIEQYGYTPKHLNKSYIKNQSLRTSAYYQLFNNKRIALIIDYPATISKSDNGIQTIRKPKLDKLTYSLITTLTQSNLPIKTKTITLVDQSTLHKINITKGDNIDDILTDLTDLILQETPITNTLDPELINSTNLIKLANLYDIDTPTYITVTHQSYHSDKTGNTYNNMYPRYYPTQESLTELLNTIITYKEYKIITLYKTVQLLKQQRATQAHVQQLNKQLNNLH